MWRTDMAEYKIALVWIDIKNPMEHPLLGKNPRRNPAEIFTA
jgi:hypothetical protein